MYAKADGINEQIVNWLCSITNYNIDRIDNELNKLQLFSKDDRVALFNLMYKENAFEDLTSTNIFDLTTAILKRDGDTIKRILKEVKYTDIEAISLNSVLRKNVKNILDIQIRSKSSASELGLSPKQFNAIKYNYINRYPDST